MVLYRKYRPQKIAELDITEVRTRLSTLLLSGRVPHAFLFAGPKGTGKTSAARIVAKVINCERLVGQRLPAGRQVSASSLKNIEPCNKCETCISITEGRNLDVLEIDAASNRGIDEIRELKEKIKFSPSSAKFKVYIIDEVHMLTTEAFNALLKTLEEPPSHAIFILATTEPEKLLPTIVSRCIRFDFKKASKEEIVHSLKRVLIGEKVKIKEEDNFLSEIANFADGSFRDATKLLEQAIAEDALTIEKVQNILGTLGDEDIKKFLAALEKRDTKKSLEQIAEMERKGVNFRAMTASLLHFLHKILLVKFGIGDETQEKFDKLTVSEIELLLKLLTKAYGEFKSTVVPSLPLEMVVVEWGEKKNN